MRNWKIGAVAVVVAAAGVSAAEVARADHRNVTAVTPMLDAVQSGQRVGTPLVISTVTGQVVNQLPPEVSSTEAVAQTLAAVNLASQSAVETNDRGIEALRTVADPLAEYNPQMNAGIDSLAALLESSAAALHPLIQPVDVLILELLPTMEQMKQP